MGILGWLAGPSPEQKQFDEALGFLDQLLVWLFRNRDAVGAAREKPLAIDPAIAALVKAKNESLRNAVQKGQRLPFKPDSLAASRKRIAQGATDVEVRLYALELTFLDFYVSEKTYLELRKGYESFASKIASALDKLPELLSPSMELVLDSIGNDFKDVGMAGPGALLLRALTDVRRVRSYDLTPATPAAKPSGPPSSPAPRAAKPWIVRCYEGVLPSTLPALDLPPDDRPDWPVGGGASFYSPLFPTPRFALQQLSSALADDAARQGPFPVTTASATADPRILRLELPLRALLIVPAEMLQRRTTYLRLASLLLQHHLAQPGRFERRELRVLALHLAASLRLSADPELSEQGRTLEAVLMGRGAPAMAFTRPEMPAQSEEAPTPQRRLSRHRLLALAAEEAWKDGSVDGVDRKMLENLARWLRLPDEDVAAASEAARARHEKGSLGSNRKLDPVKLYAKAAFLAHRSGEVSPSDEKLLAGLSKLCHLDEATLDDVMRSVRAKLANQ